MRKLWLTLAMTLPTLSGCETRVSVTDWCLNDRWHCASRQDTAATIDQITIHNAGYEKACPKQPHTCK